MQACGGCGVVCRQRALPLAVVPQTCKLHPHLAACIALHLVLPSCTLATPTEAAASRPVPSLRCYKLNLTPADWRQLLRSLPHLRLLRHSCRLLAAEVRGHGGAAQLAAALGTCTQLCIEQLPPPRPQDLARPQLLQQVLQAAGQEAARSQAGGSSTHAAFGGSLGLAAEPAGPSSGAGRLSRSCGSLSQLEQGAAAALLGGGGGRAGSSDLASDEDTS